MPVCHRDNEILRYAKILSIGLAGLTLLMALGWMRRGLVIPNGASFQQSVIPFPVSYLLSLPFAFALWVRALSREKAFTPVFLRSLATTSGAAFFAAALLDSNKYPQAEMALAATGVISGLFVFVRPQEVLAQVRRQPMLSVIALIAASASTLYTMFDFYLFERLCQSTAVVIYWVMHGLGFDIGANVGDGRNVTLFSRNFTVHVHRTCSGIEGIFLFQFLLSSLLLLDWPIFKRLGLFELYCIGFIYMFLVNCLRIASIFTLAYFAWKPDASEMMQSLRGLPIDMFHSFVGEFYYFIAFVVFAVALYRISLKSDGYNESSSPTHSVAP